LKRRFLASTLAVLAALLVVGCTPSPTSAPSPTSVSTVPATIASAVAPTVMSTAIAPAAQTTATAATSVALPSPSVPTKPVPTPTAIAPATVAPGTSPVASPSPTAAVTFPITITDDAKRLVRIDKAPQKIVSLAPSNTEILFALGLGKKIVGVTDFCDYPAEAKAIAKVGGMKPNVETIVSLAPDLIVTIGGNAELVKRFEDLKLTVIVLDPKDVGAVLNDLALVGRATASTAEASRLVTDMQTRMDAVTMRAQGAARPKVFYELDATDPAKPYTAGPGSWHDQLIAMASGANVAAGAKSAWVQFSLEELLRSDPEIVVLGDALFGTTVDSARTRPGWSALTAVKRGAIFPIDDNLISRPGPRLVDGLEALARIIHPEIFK
jgi:iron complex transport system substrate-binding protein